MALLNLRDVATSAGTAPLQVGRLFRSGQPFRLTEGDIAPIEGVVDTIVDLRDEREIRPGEWELMESHGAHVLHVPLAGQVLAMPMAGEGNLLGQFYVSMLDNSADGFVTIARAVAASGASLLHCAAGKDRTGVATAMMLDLLGVPNGPIEADYELTGQAMPQVIAQLAEIYGAMNSQSDGGAAPKPDGAGQGQAAEEEFTGIPRAFLEAPRSAIEMFLRALADRGGARGYLKAAGMDSAEIGELAERLSTPRSGV